MASLDNLPADQRAVLALVLGRGRSYDEIAGMLSIDRAAVRQRALAAFDALGPQTRVPAERRALITDYLLGQLPSRIADEMRLRLAESASERAWARVLSSEIAPLASGSLPQISAEVVKPRWPEPAAGASSPPTAADASSPPPAADASSQSPIAAAPSRPEPAPNGEPRVATRAGRGPNVSRLGGAVLIGIAVIAVVAVVVIVVGLGSGTGHRSPGTTAVAGNSSQTTTATSSPATTSAANPATSTSTTASCSAQVVAQINLTPPNSTSKAVGIAEVLKEGATDGIAIVAQKVAPNTTKPPNAYAVWLYNSPADAYFLGFVNPGVGSNERLSTAGGLPSHAARYKDLVVTLETQASPKTPGTIILQGALKGL
jgi:hypothetical protein